jgi:hypothetical protein
MKGISHNKLASKDAWWGKVADWNRVLFDAFVLKARASGDGGQFEEALQWCSVAAWFASRKGWFGTLSSRELEAELLRAARSLSKPSVTRKGGSRLRWLHVLSEAYATLGHTNLCRRWIQYDTDVVHDVVLVDQKAEAPGNLVDTVKKTGGECVVLDAAASRLKRAAELRAYAWQNADVVVLHTHPDDVIATTAFGVAGGPPVLLLNHADHAFWVGCAVADLIVDIRTSGHVWTKQARGVSRAAILPVPLLKSEDSVAYDATGLQRKRAVRRRLEIPEDATVLLTVGSASKYKPMPGLNFVNTAVEIIQQCENVRLVAVGPPDEGEWKAARKAMDGRISAVGYQPDSTLFCHAADLYLEGFPAGSLTALLEAGEAGLPCVRAPLLCIPPFSSDSAGIDNLAQPKDANEYVRTAVALVKDTKSSTELGQQLQRAIRSQHCGGAWLARLRAVKQLIPEGHSVCEDFCPVPVEQHWLDWSIQSVYADKPAPARNAVAAGVYVEAWKRTAAKPQIEAALWARLKACQTHEEQVAGRWETLLERASLWRLNKQIRRQGTRSRLIAKAALALTGGKQSLARKLTYSCLLQSPSSVGDPAWIKMLVKSHLSHQWLLGLRRMKRPVCRTKTRESGHTPITGKTT